MLEAVGGTLTRFPLGVVLGVSPTQRGVQHLRRMMEHNPNITSLPLSQFGAVHNELAREAIHAATLSNRTTAVESLAREALGDRAAACQSEGGSAWEEARAAANASLDKLLRPDHMVAIFSVYRVA